MLFSKVFTAGALMAATVMAALTPAQIADSLKKLTDQSQKLQGPAQSITIVNAPLIIIGQGPLPAIIAGFTEIVTTASAALSMSSDTPKITNQADDDLVFDAFRGFVRAHQILLNILIGKSGILTNVPFIGPPVATVLRNVEGVVDAIAFFLIDTAQGRTGDIESEASSLGDTLDLAIQRYQGLQL
ncbi:UVI-1 [Nemania sp. NC0429]|nr:UVI-1 [Nemania sp. NC0429]